MKKILLTVGTAFALASCNLDKFPSDAVSSESMSDPENSSVVTDGTYALFKAILMYDGTVYSANSYVRHYFQMAEFRGDNICLSDMTPDPLCNATRLSDVSTEGNTGYFWWMAYKIIFSANSMIEAIPEGGSALSDHILGENYFIRAVAHLHLLQIYATPYTHGTDRAGVVLRQSTDCSTTERATVGRCYEAVRDDLVKAAALMKGGSRRGNNGYVSWEAVMGLLSRVYLYMGEWDDCIDTVNGMLSGAEPSDKLDPDYEHLFQFSKDSKEVLWCVAMVNSSSDWTDQKGSMGSMFWSPDAPGGTGWGEIYYSQPLQDLFARYPQDLRYSTMSDPYYRDPSKKMIYWPVADNTNDFRLNSVDNSPVQDASGSWTCKGTDGKSYQVKERIVNTYHEYYIDYGGQETKVSLVDKCNVRRTFPQVMMKKFANMDGQPNVLNSPIIIRWAEVILNRAEAYAHKGDVRNALADVNVIRARAGLTGDAEMTESNMAARGYGDVLDVVLDERRMELCFEGHRPFDQARNKKDIDRRYGGMQPWEVVKYDDIRLPYLIPFGEISVSGIPQNPR
ncbi:MAG: RagB/SusD family nutrient uptake outer membrane protein [Bacteroidales bacterium]|nr:RagB/SusD family nutrient uptake outer membrane protein [Bacteroidales bacterium]